MYVHPHYITNLAHSCFQLGMFLDQARARVDRDDERHFLDLRMLLKELVPRVGRVVGGLDQRGVLQILADLCKMS